MRFIGITGGIGAGKSEILQYIRKHYLCEIYLADEVAHLVKEPGTECYNQLVGLLGKEIVRENGQIDKSVMAEKIFAQKEILQKVNAIVHPAVQDFLMNKLEAARKAGAVELFFVEAALLLESGYGDLVDEMWYIYADKTIRAERLRRTRGYSDDKITRIMASQLDEDAYRKGADFIIDNSGTLENSYRQIDKKLEAFTWQE